MGRGTEFVPSQGYDFRKEVCEGIFRLPGGKGMESVLLIAIFAGVFAVVVLQIALVRRKEGNNHEMLLAALAKVEASFERTDRAVRGEFSNNRKETAGELHRSREELAAVFREFREALWSSFERQTQDQKERLVGFAGQVAALTEATEKKAEELRLAVTQQLSAIQEDSSRKLEQMRLTVDEKLQGTLEKRLGESFKQVSERLEQVYKGLGEMQSLAAGVGDLKKVLTNVKSRGTWGEVMLGRLLEDVFLPDQYAANVATAGTGERVEYAVKLPGRSDDPSEVVWLPIDSKFPLESYERLRNAQEVADVTAVEVAGKQLENALRGFAKSIAQKYLLPPKTTDFAVLFLPTEGLYAEVVRKTDLVDELQRSWRVMVAGPSTLLALLTSLQMGFRTLAIEKRSSEVWHLLAAVKTEWSKYGESLAAVHKKLEQVTKSVADAQTRARAVGRKLRDVSELESQQAAGLLQLEGEHAVDSAEF
jgi:DNA recombination protein RmuC